MAIGNFGKLIVFEASEQKILTFQLLKAESESRWKEHALIGQTPKMHFLGRGLMKCNLTITLSALHGVRPKATIEAIRHHLDIGMPEYLVIKGSAVCKNRMVITKMTETWDEIWNGGELVRATLDIELKEYA